MRATVVRSAFRSQNIKSTPFSEHFWKLSCSKSATSEARKGIEVRMLKATCSAHLAKKDHNDKIEGFVL